MKSVPLTITDSIAIKILQKNAILTGVGNKLRLHSAKAPSAELSMQLRGKVHGIEHTDSGVNADKVLVYGEKEFMLLQWSTSELQFQLLYRAQLSDWISAARFLLHSREFVLLTAHSILLRFTFDSNSKDYCQIIERASCSDKSTLYCSRLHGNSWEQLVVFGGNAFGELLIWQPVAELSKTFGGSGCCPLLHRIQMHNGVIFSIDYDARAQLLTTTSDDRSIKFWQVAFDVPAVGQDYMEWATAKLTAMASGYGHVARVFQGKIINYANQLYAITVGEDSYFCIWSSTGELMHKRRHQFGATIWNFDYENATKTLFTVGSTGNLIAYGLQHVLNNQLDCISILPQITNMPGEYVAKIKFLNKDLLIGVTNKNHLLYKRLNVPTTIDDNDKWHLVKDFEAYKCTVLEVHEDLIALCGYKRLTLYKYTPETAVFTKLYDGEILSSVIRAFQFLNTQNFLISDELGNCLLLRGTDLLLRFTIELPKCKERWLTAALLIEDDFLLVSNRQGNLMLYKFVASAMKYIHSDTLKHPHGNLGATKLKLMENTSINAFVKSSGHDGTCRRLCLDKAATTLKAHAREIVPVAWVEDFFAINDADSCELLLGFNDNHFVGWSKKHDFVLQVPCGGGHRCWHYAIFEDNAHCKWLQLAFIKNKEVRLHKLRLFNETVTAIELPAAQAWHVKSCNIAALVEQSKTKATLIISAGDDNLIKISGIQHDALVQHAEVHTHISNIRALKVRKLNDSECLIFSGGGRAQLCITKLNLKNFKITELLNYTLKPKLDVKAQDYSFDPEMRLMSIDVLSHSNDSAYHIYIGCSDGYVRKLFLNEKFEIQTESELSYGKCVLQVRLIARQHVLVAATDGILQFYDLDLKNRLFSLKHHSSGINALDVLHEPTTNQLHLLSGGDDQSVVYSQLNWESPEHANVCQTLHLNGLHTAQVTAACLRRTLNALYAFTSGVDQVLTKFNLLDETPQEEAIRFNGCVADVKGLCLDANQRCFIYGCGLQTHSFIS